jgi:UDP-GlcNAc:undecaprenyl-phosphate/decaprenyl-phosphate GlcNAc-1-phosphate transferase
MTTILSIFAIALGLSLVLTPLVKRLGLKLGTLDIPDDRKIHTSAIARCGGVGIFVAFVLSLLLSSIFFKTSVPTFSVFNSQTAFVFLGALIAFGIGLVDDFHRLGSTIKFIFHILAATAAFLGGLQIGQVNIFGVNIQMGILSYALTLFWFVFFINAMNLIDGLDGLAGGITFFACVVMVVLAALKGNFLIAMLFAALGGSTLGFLHYNFNPASIFLGDSGSYFLGYSIAALSIMGSIKSQIWAIILIPLVALGVPVFDTILSPIRRFIMGTGMFNPDKCHIHHKLIEKGLSTKRVVWTIYGISIVLCILSLLVVNLRDAQVGIFLVALGVVSFIVIRKLGYFEYITSEKIFGWLKDLTDEAGIKRDRRTFLHMQVQIAASKNIYELWGRIIEAANKIHLDAVTLNLHPRAFNTVALGPFIWERGDRGKEEMIQSDGRYITVEVPIVSNGTSYAVLRLRKSMKKGSVDDRFILNRIEHLRRTVTDTMGKLAARSLTYPEVFEDRCRPDNEDCIEWAGPERRDSSLSE